MASSGVRYSEGAIAQRVAAQRLDQLNPTECSIKVRCGIHYGEVIEADGDVFGVAVYLAARVCSSAHGGEILLSAAAREAIGGEGLPLNALGPTLLPGFEEPVRLFELAWPELSDSSSQLRGGNLIAVDDHRATVLGRHQAGFPGAFQPLVVGDPHL